MLTSLGTEVLAGFWSDAHPVKSPEDKAVIQLVLPYTEDRFGEISRQHVRNMFTTSGTTTETQNMQNTSLTRSTNTENGKRLWIMPNGGL
jgi:hypothetical protein